MTLRQRDITIEVREIPLPFLRLHVGPDYIGVPKAPGTERDSRPGCRLREMRSEEHTSELQSRLHLVCRLLLEKKKKKQSMHESCDMTYMVYLITHRVLSVH